MHMCISKHVEYTVKRVNELDNDVGPIINIKGLCNVSLKPLGACITISRQKATVSSNLEDHMQIARCLPLFYCYKNLGIWVKYINIQEKCNPVFGFEPFWNVVKCRIRVRMDLLICNHKTQIMPRFLI